MPQSQATSESKTATTAGASGAHEDQTTFRRHDVDSDIGGKEAYETNLKRIVDDYAHWAQKTHEQVHNHAESLLQTERAHIATLLSNERAHVEEIRSHANDVRAEALAMVRNGEDAFKRVMTQATRHGDLAIDRQWNVDEQGAQAVAAINALVRAGVTDTALLASLAKFAEAAAVLALARTGETSKE